MSECKYFMGYDPSGVGTDMRPRAHNKEYGSCGRTKHQRKDEECRVINGAVQRFDPIEGLEKPHWCSWFRAFKRNYCNK